MYVCLLFSTFEPFNFLFILQLLLQMTTRATGWIMTVEIVMRVSSVNTRHVACTSVSCCLLNFVCGCICLSACCAAFCDSQNHLM